MDLEAILAGARAAAREAAALVLPAFRTRPSIEHKAGALTDLVTEHDRASEKLLRERLRVLLPSAAIVGEEAADLPPEEETQGVRFYVDPIDGTTNFVHGHPFWCISIGLVVNGSPVLGVVRAPALGVEWFGWLDAAAKDPRHGTIRRGEIRGEEERCTVSPTMTLVESLLATGFPYDRSVLAPHHNFDAFIAIKKKCQAVRRCGSAALDLCLVADGTYDGYWERKLNPWDVAAGIALVRAAGGNVTDLRGQDLTIHAAKTDVVATNGRIHALLTHELAPFL